MTKLLFILLLLFGCSDDFPMLNQDNLFGCTNDTACNYNPNANNDDNSCFFPEDWEDECGVCDLDTSNDCVQDCSGVWGGDAEDADNDGICDNIDDCFGVYDNCGICNGSNESVIDNCGTCEGNEPLFVELWGECYNIEETVELRRCSGSTDCDALPVGGVIPEQITKLLNLEILDISGNNFTGSIPEDFTNLVSLEKIWINDNFLSGEVPSFFWSLEANISNNQFSGILPENICDLIFGSEGFSNVYFHGNNFCPPYPSCFSENHIDEIVGFQNTSNCD